MSAEPQQEGSTPPQIDQPADDSEVQLIATSSSISSKIAEKRHDTETCPICLFKISDEVRCFANQCFHSFCYECLLEWSKVKPSCPLCKTPFSVIIHEIRSNDAYKEHRIIAEPSTSILSTPHVANNRLNWLYHNMRTQAANTWYAGHQEAPIAFRRLVYLNDWYVSLTHMDTRATGAQQAQIEPVTRYRETRASFYRKNSACTHRLHSFVVRELITINRLTGQYMAPELRRPIGANRQKIFDLLVRHDIDSEGFLNKIRQFIKPLRFAKHFQHELYAYARSICHTMLDYDARSVYFEGRTNVPVNMSEFRLYSENPPAAIWNEVYVRDSLSMEDEQVSRVRNETRLGINEAIMLDEEASEASVQRLSESDASNYCEEVEASSQSSPDYIVLSSDDGHDLDDSGRKRFWTSDSEQDSMGPSTSRKADERLRKKSQKKKSKKKGKKKKRLSVDRNESSSESDEEESRDCAQGTSSGSKMPLVALRSQVARLPESSDES